VLTHHDERGGFFTLLLQPPERVAVSEILPKELIFVLDTSGSMSGFPIEKAKETMSLALDGLHPQDTFNLITFSGDTHILFPDACAGYAREPAPGAGVPASALRQRWHGDDEGHPRRAGGRGSARSRAGGLLHDGWRSGQRSGDPGGGAEALQCARLRVRDRQLGQSFSAGQLWRATGAAQWSMSA
jgi:hypothetical protein